MRFGATEPPGSLRSRIVAPSGASDGDVEDRRVGEDTRAAWNHHGRWCPGDRAAERAAAASLRAGAGLAGPRLAILPTCPPSRKDGSRSGLLGLLSSRRWPPCWPWASCGSRSAPRWATAVRTALRAPTRRRSGAVSREPRTTRPHRQPWLRRGRAVCSGCAGGVAQYRRCLLWRHLGQQATCCRERDQCATYRPPRAQVAEAAKRRPGR